MLLPGRINFLRCKDLYKAGRQECRLQKDKLKAISFVSYLLQTCFVYFMVSQSPDKLLLPNMYTFCILELKLWIRDLVLLSTTFHLPALHHYCFWQNRTYFPATSHLFCSSSIPNIQEQLPWIQGHSAEQIKLLQTELFHHIHSFLPRTGTTTVSLLRPQMSKLFFLNILDSQLYQNTPTLGIKQSIFWELY